MNFSIWLGPSILALVLIIELFFIILLPQAPMRVNAVVESKQVGIALLGPYVLGVGLSSLLLTAGLVGAYHLGKREKRNEAS